ncbi:uncharacterized protein LOC128261264 isoform X2 [Drosophila gunungcola]|uniref:uncharacterized protein LOC128261264 isoform X2 n=1 Tax=Drosophila gunungcola TaxID=103775 RepID=UPI0022E0CFE9|nr:uncharacterized protein LOC128261264 isoform X2 [Drosophila gunungcola]XP_052850822.1 uncharacterized protein LOC128261264 isoform X2 [Drosophila gunungcola]XP_052850823.1 uncharacterized protein LOC128261264 isoform X2 [Drosophila gunungcola]
MSTLDKSFVGLTGLLLLTAGYIYIFKDSWQPLCSKPFVKIGERCYFFSSNKAPSYEYYRMVYKDRELSVPVIMDWMHANFGCEMIDPQSRLVTVRSFQEMRLISDFMRYGAHAQTHSVFWSGGHRGRLSDPKDVDHGTLVDFYWHQDPHPMNFTNFLATEPSPRKFANGFCVYLEFTGEELLMGVEKCDRKIAFVCELN